jgi:PAS domain S-box-containing protein
MLWLYLLGVVTVLTIAVRRLLRKQKPLSDEVYSNRVAIDHVHSGVAWVRATGRVHSLNPALTQMLRTTGEKISGSDWMEMFAKSDRAHLEEVYRQMLLGGIVSLTASTVDSRGSEIPREVTLVAVHDHKMRFVGHHCIVERIVDPEESHSRVSRTEFATLSS